MGNCGGTQQDMSVQLYMQKYHPTDIQITRKNQQRNKKSIGNLNGQVFNSSLVSIDDDNEQQKENVPKTKISKDILKESARLANKSSVPAFLEEQHKIEKQNKINVINVEADKSEIFANGSANPFDVNLLDPKEAILYKKSMYKFNFNDFNPYIERFVVITKSAVRVYENRQQSFSTYGKPMLAIPLKAIKKIQRIKFDQSDDQRLENVDEKTKVLNQHMFEFELKDEFLPIYLHQQYARMFKDTSMTMELSPSKNRSVNKGSSPMRNSTISYRSTSKMGSNQSPGRGSLMFLDMHKKTGNEQRQSPSKAARINLRYINPYPDVGPQIAQTPITYENLVELSKSIDKKEMWVRSDQRLIFALESTQITDETIEALNKILQN